MRRATLGPAPDVDEVLALDVENEMGIACQWPDTQARHLEFVSVARGLRAGVAADPGAGLFQCVDEAKRHRRGALAQGVGNGLVDVLASQLARNDRFSSHLRE